MEKARLAAAVAVVRVEESAARWRRRVHRAQMELMVDR